MKTEKELEQVEVLPKKSKIPYFFFVFFGVVFAVNFFYIYISQKTWRGVVTKDSYQKGLNYNDTLKQVENQKNLGWQVKISYQPQENGGHITVALLDDKSVPITDAKIYASFKRPIQEGFDFDQEIPFQDGSYQADIVFPLKGQWDAEITITKGEDSFVEVKRYIIQ